MLHEPAAETSSIAPKHQPPRILVLFGSAAIFGAERGNLEALMALKAQGAEILCLIRDETWSNIVPPALDARGIAWRKVPYVEHWRRSRAHVVMLRGPWAWLTANWRFLKAVREFKPTHIHAYSQLFVANFLIGLSLTKTPLVFRAGDEPTLHNAFWRATWNFTVRRTARFVANAEFIARSLRNHDVPGERISVIYNVPPTRPQSAPGTLKLELPQGTRLIAFVGQIAEHKGPHLLVDAFKSVATDFKDARLLLAGRIDPLWEGDAWARTLKHRTLTDELLRDRVCFLGLVEDISTVYEVSAFVVVPSIFQDPAPNVIMEAKAAGRAIIGFPTGGIPEFITHGVDGLICDCATVPALCVALRHYLENPNIAKQHGAAGRQLLADSGFSHFGKNWRMAYTAALTSAAPSAKFR